MQKLQLYRKKTVQTSAAVAAEAAAMPNLITCHFLLQP